MKAVSSSLVQYNQPVLVSHEKSKDLLHKQTSNTHEQKQIQNIHIEDILNSILPPKEWSENDQLWVQYVSSRPSTRNDVINLQQNLDLLLQSRQARDSGIDSTRQELYYQCFDELIRQITITCSERGLLLLRIRDELRSTAVAYEKLYESNVAHGIRKSLMAEHTRVSTEEKIKELTAVQDDLKFQVENLKKIIVSVSALAKEKQQVEARHHQEEADKYKRMIETSKAAIDAILNPSTSGGSVSFAGPGSPTKKQ